MSLNSLHEHRLSHPMLFDSPRILNFFVIYKFPTSAKAAHMASVVEIGDDARTFSIFVTFHNERPGVVGTIPVFPGAAVCSGAPLGFSPPGRFWIFPANSSGVR